MSTASYSQVWQQVMQWSVELRRDLAEEIIRSVESDLPTSNGPWSEGKNARRCELIDKDIQGTIQAAERRELELLACEMRVHRRRVAPISLEGAKALHRQLLDKKRQHEGTSAEES